MEIAEKKLTNILQEQRKAMSEDVKRHIGVLTEDFDSKVQLIAEQYESIIQRLDNVEAKLGRAGNDLIEIKENIVYSHQHEDLKVRVDVIEEKIGIIS